MDCTCVDNRAPHSNPISSRGCGPVTFSGAQSHAPRRAYEAVTRPQARAGYRETVC